MGKFIAFFALKSLCENKNKNTLISKLSEFLNKNYWTSEDRQLILSLLSEALLDKELRPLISRLFAPILSELFVRLTNRVELRVKLFVTISHLIGCYGCSTQFAYHCFQSSIFCPKDLLGETKSDDSVLDILIASFKYLHFHSLWFRDAIDWSFISSYLSHSKPDIKYIAIKCYQILFSLSDNQFQTLFGTEFNGEELTELRVKYNHLFLPPKSVTQIKNSLYYDNFQNDCHHYFDDKDFSEEIICVFGVLVNKFKNCDSLQTNPFNEKNRIVLVPTTQTNIRCLALAVSYGKPILVEGPVGCGKTLLIEYMSSLTRRYKSPHLMKVQMGDQIDTKILIGSHICTDIPGEFIWKAGPLTQAMKYGYWLILEDIDCAPSDVISMLSSVLEAKSLSSLPGCENQLNRVHNEFRIFFTRRLTCAQNNDSNHSEFAVKSSLHYNCLNKLCYKISLDLLSREELQTLISTKWQNLSPISERILDIYYYLKNENLENIGIKRQISLRDLMKWCQRISKNFKLDSNESALMTFLDANDCFLQSISSPDLRITKAEVIGSHLNITKSQSEYLCAKRKPEFLLNDSVLRIGRTCISLKERDFNLFDERKRFNSFALTLQSLSLLERISVAVQNNESVLLCGETGTGKTSCVQYLAHRLNKSLTVVNMNQQSDSSDLLGGYKPIEMKVLMEPIKNHYLELFSKTFDSEKNISFLMKFSQKFQSEDWITLLKIMVKVYESALIKCSDKQELLEQWKQLSQRINRLQSYKLCEKGCLAFSFIDGSLVKAMRNGDWILLDEINLAETETLQCLSAILDSDDGSVMLLDKADGLPVKRSPEFRLFACMNPATDIGKKELPLGIRNRFSEFFVDELEDKSDLRILVHSYIGRYVSPNLIESIVNFYLQIKTDAKQVLTDANGMRPLYSLRTLCRALGVSATNPCGIVMRSLYESFCLSFLTRLDQISRIKVEIDIIKALFGSKDSLNLIKAKLEAPKSSQKYECIEGFYIIRGLKEPKINESYILTPTVQKNLKDICRIVSIGKTFPILLEGETSVGKTSLIEWLAAATGNVCVRVNNHEHTDLQEYVGSYCVNTDGKLVFKEGVLAEAMRNGYWIILDELNLAPTEVLEALNRVLDDNRELFIPETQQLIKADPKFLLLATQNPAGHYGGRKLLSRAFRNRFVELHFDVIPSEELEVILHRRCSLPMSYSKRMVGVLLDLQIRRRESGVFAGKHGFITLRDLFRWGERYKRFAKQNDLKYYDWDLNLANTGYMLLAGRVRRPEEMSIIQSVLESRFKRKLDIDSIFNGSSFLNDFSDIPKEYKHIVWNKSFKRLGTLLSEAIKYNEPVLLVGETGCGKTSICQLFAAINDKHLYSVNCHMNTESADFLGSLRPVRQYDNNVDNQSSRPLFEWVDGPLVDAMKSGDYFLVDEISLADDSVLERLNSVLESERTLLIAENNNTFDNEMSIPIIKANDSFRYLATMNPGGDYGKKELSPALRNRFTEIWCPPYEDIYDIKDIICHNLDQQWIHCKEIVCQSICDFLLWFNSNVFNSKRITLSIRDVLSWIQFINVSTQSDQVIPLALTEAFINGALLVFVDGIGCGNYINFNKNPSALREECHKYLIQSSKSLLKFNSNFDKPLDVILDENKYFRIGGFCIPKTPKIDLSVDSQYMWNSPTVKTNALRVLRAITLPKPILLEGMPGVGKTSLVQALAKSSGHKLIRINLSEQTDISDLFGSDLPIEGQDSAGKFAFRDGPLLQALKSEWTWIVLDELNLATQSVLEGLNACLDHRNEIFIPELNKSFKISKTMTRIFATQNPHSEGGARKGLPRSFINRFTTVYMESLSKEDYIFILSNMFPNIQQSIVKQMVDFNNEIINEIVINKHFARKGNPWEFNLRDLIRWSQVMTHNISDFDRIKPEKFIKLLFIDKMRTIEDRIKMKDICDKYFDYSDNCQTIDFEITDSYLQIGHSFLKRGRNLSKEINNLFIFESQKECLESLMKCIEMNWMSILIGETGTGKTTAVQLLSDLTGHKLHIFSVNSEMDTMDLLGGFEQKDLSHRLTHIEDTIIEFCSKFFQKSVEKQKIKQIMCFWFEIQTLNSMNELSDEISLKKLKILNQIIDKILEMNSKETQVLIKLKDEIKDLKSNYENTELLNGTFEWRDSILIRALISGDWLLIDNANLCSASVLDRLNPLLEPNGELTINEKGCIDGRLTSVKPHRDFRLFLSMNPINGELSRAMRNRGIEINMFPITSKQDFNKQICGLVESNDNISQFFTEFLDNICAKNEKFCFSQIIENIKSFIFQIQNGFKLEICLKEFYSKFDKHLITEEIQNSIDKIVSINKSEDVTTLLDINHFKYDSSTSCALEDSSLLKRVLKLEDCSRSVDFNYEYSTALRIYLEKSSLKDHSIRDYILKDFPFDENFKNNKQLVNQINENVRKIATNCLEVNILNEFQIDLRFLPNVWNLFLNLNNCFDNNMEPIEEQLNRYSINLFWNQLKSIQIQTNQTNDRSIVSFMRIASDIKDNKINRKSFPKVFVPIYEIICEIEDKLINRSLELCPTADDYITLRDILLWFDHLLTVCHQNYSKTELLNTFITEKFIVVWILTIEKSVSILQSFLDIDLNSGISSVNEMLKIQVLDSNKKEQKLVNSLTKNFLIFKNEETAKLYISYTQLIDDMLRISRPTISDFIRDFFLMIAQNIYVLVSNQYNRLHLEKDISFIKEKLQNLSNIEMISEDMIDFEAINRRKRLSNKQFEPLVIFSFFCSEISYLVNKSNNFFDNYLKLIESKDLILNPIHISCLKLSKNCDFISTDLMIQNLIDFNQFMKIDTILTHLTLDCNHSKKTFESEFLDQKLLESTADCLPFISLVSSHLLSDKHNSIGLLNTKISQLKSLKQFLTLNFDEIYDRKNKCITKVYFEFTKNWFSSLVQNICVNSPVKRKSLNVKNEGFNEMFNKISNLIEESKDSFDESIVSIFVGLISSQILCPIFSIDPIERNNYKLNHCLIDLKLIETEINVRNILSAIKSNNSSVERSDHSLIKELVERQSRLKKKIKKYESNSTFRSSSAQYFQLKSDCIQFLETILEMKIENYSKELIDSYRNPKSLSEKSSEILIQKSINIQMSINSFIKRIQSTYPLYKDLINVFLIGVHLLLKGFKNATFLLKKQNFVINKLKFNCVSDLNTIIKIMGNFCNTNSPEFIANYLCDSKTINNLTKLSNVSKIDFEFIVSTLLRSALLEIQNQIQLNSCNSLVLDSFRILNVFVKSWQTLRQNEEIKRQEEEAFFEYKTKTHESELSEEELDKKQLNNTFPTYHEHYKDFIDEITLEDKQIILIDSKSEEDIISDIIRIHLKIVNPLNKTDENVPNFRESYILRHLIISQMTKSLGIFFDNTIDSELIDGQLIACNQMICDIENSYSMESFNIYHNSSLHETNLCFKILESLENRIINELLPQFENHPILVKLLKIIKTIYDFNWKDPLIKLATGLEVLLKGAQDWQIIAHKGISLVDNLNEITQLMIGWRKMELNYWSECLDSVNTKINEKQTKKFWFHLFITITALRESNLTKDCNQNEIKEFVVSIKQFIENSKLGEFKTRLNLLQSFMFHVLFIESDPKNDCLFISLYNLYNFYSQFVENIENALISVRNPIEKEVKQFVKIAKWNDHNFWSVKSAVDKSHNQLFKFMKKYESALNQPINSYLVVQKNENNSSYSEWNLCLKFEKQFKTKTENIESLKQLIDYKFLQRSNVLTKKSRLLSKRTVKNSSFLVNKINSIESFTSELIIGIKELSELQVSADIKDNNKWKQSAHHIQNRKQKALSELMKTLTLLGLSYRKGLIINNEFDINYIIMTTGPLDYKNQRNVTLSQQISEDMSSCDKYFFKCLARFASLTTGLETPNKQLSKGNIDRIKGFSTQLMKKVIEIRNTISQNIFVFNRFKSIEQNLKNFLKTNELSVIVPNKEFEEYLKSAQNIIINIMSFILRSIDLLDSLSTSIEEPVLLLSDSSNVNISQQNINEWKHCLNDFYLKLNEIINKLKKFEFENLIVCSSHDLNQIKDIYKSVSTLMIDLQTFYRNQNFSALNLENNFSILYNESHILITKFFDDSDIYSKYQNSDEIFGIDKEIDLSAKYSINSIKMILFATETIYKSFNKSEDINTAEEDFLKNSLNSIDLINILKRFEIEKTFNSITKFLEKVNITSKPIECSEKLLFSLRFRAQIVRNVYPFIENYGKLFEYFLTLSVSSLRTSNKLLLILLSLFSDLSQNGFCSPQELSDESDDKDNGSELKNVEDGGLGEGQGTKDISDKIESEDQLEDAFKEGAERTEENEERDIEEEDNGIEMQNDFDGQTFSPSKGDNEENKNDSDGDESDNDLEDQMGDVDNNSDVLDEKIWGSDEDIDSDHSDGEEDETGFAGKDSVDNKVVAKNENKDLQKDLDENQEKEDNNGSDSEINENELQNDDYEDEGIDPYKQNDPKNDKSKQEFPENMTLDENEENEEQEENSQELDNISISGLSSGDDEKSQTDEQNIEDIELSEEELNDKQIDENNDKIGELDNQIKNEEKIEENESKEKDDNESKDKSSINQNKESDHLANNQLNGSDGRDNDFENEMNAKNSSDVCIERNEEISGQQNEMIEEQHGFNESLVGDNSTQTDGQQMLSSVTLDDSEAKEEKLRQNNKRDKNDRTLAENYDKNIKRQKVVPNDNSSEQQINDLENQRLNSKLYRHIDNKLKDNNEVIDIATNEEKLEQNEDLEKENKNDFNSNNTEDMEIDENNESIDEIKSIDYNSAKTNPNSSDNNRDLKSDMNNEEVMQIEGQTVDTHTVQRGYESTFHTSLDLIHSKESEEMSVNYDKQFDENSFQAIKELDIKSVIDIWKECEFKVSPLVYELCERLQLVLEPTKTAKLKGDYRTGKRLNMRKVIAYIASDFRKDKIWLRRTKPSKRQYQIVIAIDDSSSMADNKSKQLAFESLALLGKSLSLLEAGELAVISFGQTVNLLHSFSESFNDNTGAKLLTQLTFEQNQTRIADLMLSVIEMMSTSRRVTTSQSVDISQLLIIVSDGRGIYSEGEHKVKQTLRKIKELGIFTVFVVIDNPLNKDSILDIRVPIFDNSGKVRIESYMERFPFPFYILLRDINGLPVVMGEALRQWFELITSGQT